MSDALNQLPKNLKRNRFTHASHNKYNTYVKHTHTKHTHTWKNCIQIDGTFESPIKWWRRNARWLKKGNNNNSYW